jgi:signal transduction histidine kinase
MTKAPSLEDLFTVVSAVSFGQSAARVALPEQPQLDDPPTRLGIALNLLLDDLALRATERERLAERLKTLADASREFSAATGDVDDLLGVVARRLGELLGDMCVIRAVTEDGQWLEATGAAYHRDPTLLAVTRALMSLDRQRLGEGVSGRVAATGLALLTPKISTAEYVASSEPRYRPYLERLGVTSSMTLPLLSRGKVVGVANLMRSAPEHPYDDDDFNFAQNVADHAALAVENARSYAAERAARATAEKAKDDLSRDAAERLRLEEQLRQSQKMEAVGKLAGGVAHDFNNVLSVILSYGDLLLSDLKPGDPMRADVEEIKKAGARAADLTRQLLMFSRQQVLEPKVLDLNDVLARMDKMLQRILGADVDLLSMPAQALGRVRVDPSSIEQVIMNLVVNARDAMPTGGKLTMETDNVVLDEAYARGHLGVTPGPHVMLAITDTGTGIDKATLTRIFEPFFTTKPMGKGTGLGLSTVFGIVSQSGGSVWVYSEIGKGTTFKVYLPRVAEAVDVLLSVAAPASARGSETILLVEDDDQLRVVARGILARNGYHVIDARNAGEALLHAEKHPGLIHLLLSDVVMPQMSGPELAKRLARARPRMKVLCMSGYTDDSIVRHGVLEAQMAFLQKPITPESLTMKVREVLNGKR